MNDSHAGEELGPRQSLFQRSARVRLVSFTGSTEVGRTLLAEAAKTVVNTSMELGGNAPFVVFDDADIEAAVTGAMIAKMRDGGQSCVAANRFLVHEAVADDFATDAGSSVATGGSAPESPGFVFAPTVLTGVDHDDPILGDLARAMRVSEALEYGMVGINRGFYSDPAAPFGGIKQSGIGREGSHEGMMEFLETKYVAADW